MELVQIGLLVLLGAAVANCLDVMFHFTPRIADWLKKVFEESVG
jgi:lipoprotein signal peptidase